MEPLNVTPKDAQKITGDGRNVIYEAVQNGTLRVIRNGRKILIPVAELRRWQAERFAAQNPEAA